jgi:hypothetical protein
LLFGYLLVFSAELFRILPDNRINELFQPQIRILLFLQLLDPKLILEILDHALEFPEIVRNELVLVPANLEQDLLVALTAFFLVSGPPLCQFIKKSLGKAVLITHQLCLFPLFFDILLVFRLILRRHERFRVRDRAHVSSWELELSLVDLIADGLVVLRECG